MRIVCVSDTHRHHGKLKLPRGDVLVHAGDFTVVGRVPEIDEFAAWLASTPFAHKIVVAGNHDLMLRGGDYIRDTIKRHCPDAHYLQDSGATVGGLRFWGAPWGPEFTSLALTMPKGDDLARRWALIPAAIDVLVTHLPPHGLMDSNEEAHHEGCEVLLREVSTRIRPRAHIFGHCHCGYGEVRQGGTHFINAASCDQDYQLAHAPICVDLA